MDEQKTEKDASDHEARMRGVPIAQFRLAVDFVDAILRDVFQSKRDHLRGQMLDVAAKVSRKHPWPYFDECVEAEVERRLDPSIPPVAPSCEDWPECALDDDRCAAVAVMGRGTCPRIPPDKEVT